jgi:hypothetical protein
LVEDRHFEDCLPGAIFEYAHISATEAEMSNSPGSFEPHDMRVSPGRQLRRARHR